MSEFIKAALRKRRTYLVLMAVVLFFLFVPSVDFLPSAGPSSRNPPNEIQNLIYFLNAFPSTSLPADMNPEERLDENFWAHAVDVKPKEWRAKVNQLEISSPVVMFSKSFCPYSKRAKSLLAAYALDPAPLIYEVDHRDDSTLIKNLLTRITGRSTFPNIIVNGVSIGGADELGSAHRRGELRELLERAGCKVSGSGQDFEE